MFQSRNVEEGLIGELLAEEDRLIAADGNLAKARTDFEVNARKYAAVRDMLFHLLGHNPYVGDQFKRALGFNYKGGMAGAHGRYQYIYMKPGDAVIDVLRQSPQPMGLEEIVERVKAGGIRLPSVALTRAVNAALMRTTGVVKDEATSKYSYKQEEPGESVDDLPF